MILQDHHVIPQEGDLLMRVSGLRIGTTFLDDCRMETGMSTHFLRYDRGGLYKES